MIQTKDKAEFFIALYNFITFEICFVLMFACFLALIWVNKYRGELAFTGIIFLIFGTLRLWLSER
jgi:hypothetical protein